MIKRYLPFLLIFSFQSFAAKDLSEESLWEYFYLGEHIGKAYSGANDHRFLLNQDNYSYQFLDEIFAENYSENLISPELVGYKSFFLYQLPKSLTCSIGEVSKNLDYTRYLYRLMGLSYLWETYSLYSRKDLPRKYSECKQKISTVLESCRAKSDDMLKFVERAKGFYGKTMTNLASLSSLEKKILKSREDAYCRENKCSGSRHWKNICSEDLSLFAKICSEDDTHWGYEEIPELRLAIADSTVMSLLGGKERGKMCLDTFSRLFKHRETVPYEWKELFPLVYKKLESAKEFVYIQGRLFIPGSLKPFDLKGVGNFLVTKVKPTPVPTARPTPLPTPKPTPTPKALKVVKLKVRPTPKPTPSPTPTPIPLSPFEEAVRGISQGSSKYSVPTSEMRKWFSLSKEKVARNAVSLDEFQARSVLLELKEFYKFGTKAEPVRLLFLWYLIHEKKHQGLYNVLFVLGNEFFVINDLEGKKDPVKIRLTEKKSSWELEVLKE